MNVAKGKEIFILSMLSLFILWISPALAFDPKDDRMEVNIQLNMSWTTGKGEKNIQEKGSASIKIFGEIELEKKHRESLHYRATNLKATYSFTNTYYYVGGSCKNCCSEELPLTIEKGSGSIEPKNFKLRVSVGRQGNRMAQEEGCLEPVNGVYHLSVLVPISTSFEYVQKGCFPSPYPGRAEGKRKFDIYGSKPLDASGIYGSYKLTGGGGFFVGYGIDAKVWDYCGKTKQIIMDERSILAGNAQANLHWQIGKIKPIVKIWRHYNDRKPEDITDAKPMKVPVIVGEKIILEAEILPPGTEINNGEWKIDDKKVIAGYEANSQKGQVLNLTKEDYKKKKIEFYWIDGGFSGFPENITYSADSKKGKVQGKTTITVFEPEVRMEKKCKPPHIDLWPVEDDKGKVIGQVCRLYLGDRSRLPRDTDLRKGQITPERAEEVNKRAARDSAGIFIESTIILPGPFSNREHSLEYIQLIKELILETYDIQNICTRADNWLCDKNYPYAKKVAERTIYIDDSPSSDLGLLTHMLNHYQTFQTFLMFRPCPLSKAQGDENSVWVPLRVVEWEWKASGERVKPYSNNDHALPEEFRRRDLIIPDPDVKDWGRDVRPVPESYPQWDGNVEPEKDRRKQISDTGYSDQTAWRKLLEEFTKIGSKESKKSKK
jgi:hypothetical protein